MAKKKTTEKALNIDNILFNCRDYLRAARNSGSFFEKRDMMKSYFKYWLIRLFLKEMFFFRISNSLIAIVKESLLLNLV